MVFEGDYNLEFDADDYNIDDIIMLIMEEVQDSIEDDRYGTFTYEISQPGRNKVVTHVELPRDNDHYDLIQDHLVATLGNLINDNLRVRLQYSVQY
ncbi:Hypothetical protein ORPV_555 [Orpheovirus IHUMI-LCC2]|uniref:Uncharacterized protein n=1 Tax=Orpheovirus IHUMI-LCC2 TaxID=2023057 RepID=A0A2I2L4S2_9VIRU|nr:Hypothetical protein ORPV_555 [Orpheovirus IHUMI-LCC2]SNW62459.1 Hypothetical protein ORPV_555 [Orpheovirus IHUMI-LCC2]